VIALIKAAYLHIPFCEHICHYCDFNKVFLKGQPVDEYLRSLEIEIKNTLASYPTTQLSTIYVGGGTPTSLSLQQLEYFLDIIQKHLFPRGNIQEFTFEANPGKLEKEKLQLLKEAGVNRISFGVQSLDDELLHRIGRTHRKKDVMDTIALAQDVGFENINIDLMYGLPGQTMNMFKETIELSFQLNVQHFSAYSLIVEPKTVFYNLMMKGQLHLPTQDEEADMYEYIMDQMNNHGYIQYELSNFALKGYESRHNLTYWDNEEYYGFGAGAHSYIHGTRRSNAGPLKKYMKKIEEKGFPFLEENQISKEEAMEEEMFLGLRKTEGVSKRKFFEKYNLMIEDVFQVQIDEQKRKGLLEETEEFIRLTHKGKMLGNEVFQAFLTLSNR
jgi:oxygen-independent coproporphyrinogen III oxidase